MAQVSLSEFADKMGEVMPIIMKEFARRQLKELYKDNITLPQFLILGFLEKEGQLKMTTLAQFMQVTTAAMTGIVDRLVRGRYVLRAYDPKDRRIIKVGLTAKGSNLLKNINTQRRKMVIGIFGKISQADRSDYLRILMQIKEILATESPARK